MKDEKEVQKFIEQWIDENRGELPVNVDNWKVKIVDHQNQGLVQSPAEPPAFNPFFKSISRLIDFGNEQ